MEVSLLNKGSLRIKGKNAVIVVYPTRDSPKTEADAVLLLTGSTGNISSKIENARVAISGPGEYEIGGVKIAGIYQNGKVVYTLDIDGVKVALGNPAALEKAHDRIAECQLAILNINEPFEESVFSSLEPNVAVLYGEGVAASIKSLGIDIKARASKYAIAAEKIPQEFETIVLE